MKVFQTIQELVNYVPNCLICKKEMQVSLSTYLSSNDPKRRVNSRESVSLRFELENCILHSKHKSYQLKIDTITNVILEGQDLADRFTTESTYIKKKCPTCHLKIETICSNGTIKKEKRFPDLTLRHEELHFTMRGGKDLSVSKYYSTNTSPEGDSQAQIMLNHKYLPPVPFDFNKFNSFEQLVNRINTIVLFH